MKAWSDLTEKERAPILMAHKMGITIQWYARRAQTWQDEHDSCFNPESWPNLAYRIKPIDE